MAGVIAYSVGLVEQFGNPGESPGIAGEAERPRPPEQCVSQPAQVQLRQTRLAAGSPGAAQGAASTALPLGVPARDALAADPKLPGDGCQVQSASGEQASRLEAATLQASEVALCWWHVLMVTENGPNVTLLCENHTGRASLLTLWDCRDQWPGIRRKITSGRSGVNQPVRSWENFAALA
jgi:hypothetical protein